MRRRNKIRIVDWILETFGPRWAQAADRRRLQTLVQQGVVSIGVGSYGIPKVLTFRGCSAKLFIGPYVSITSGATVLLGGNHPQSWTSLYPFRARFELSGAYADGMPSAKGDVHIGPDAWIGHEALIMSGACIGTGAIVAARAVVTGVVPDYAIVAGNPARLIRYRFDEQIRSRLLATKWWELPRAEIETFVPQLSSLEVNLFLDEFEKHRVYK